MIQWLKRLYARLIGVPPRSIRMEWDDTQDVGDGTPYDVRRDPPRKKRGRVE